jgi:hypothetical protein
MTRRTLLALAPALASIAAACPPAGTTTAAAAPAGCYQFERDAGARALGLPWGFVLEDEPLGAGWPLVSDRPGVRRARTATSPTARADQPFGYWAPLTGDSIEIGHPGGGGVVLTLGRAGQDLVGRGVAAGDALPPGAAAGPRTPVGVVARRVLCGAS